MTYLAKKDMWILALLLTVVLLQFGGAVVCLGAAVWKHEPGLSIPGTMLATVGLLLLWMLYGSSYEVTATHLVLKIGPLRWRLSLDSLLEIKSTSRLGKDFGWGLALSLDRVRIRCRDRLLPFWISPEDKAGFIAELVRARPDVKVTSD